MNKHHYDIKDILNAYSAIGVEKGAIVVLRTDLTTLGRFTSDKTADLLNAHFHSLSELINFKKGTLVVQTASTSICNTDTPFDIRNTPSETGILTEFIRTCPGAVRSRHPFVSYSAIGKHAKDICYDTSRHAFGPFTPEARLVEHNALNVSVGIHSRKSTTTIHHAEQMMCVPYRYCKEFNHDIIDTNGVISREKFYMYVWYRECDISRNLNKNIFANFLQEGNAHNEATLGRGKVYSMNIRSYYESCLKSLKNNIYSWLDFEPTIKPFAQ